MQSKLAIGGVFAAVGATVVGLAIAFGGSAPQEQQPIQPAGDVVQVQHTTTSPATSAAPISTTTTPPVVAAPPAAATTTAKLPKVQQAPVVVAAEPEPTTTAPALTTVPPAETQPGAQTAWCYNPDGQHWYSGAGEGCTPSNPHFREWR
jgi:hypothetical protein